MFNKGCIALSFLCLTGCASIVSQSSYPIAINSQPRGANFYIANEDGEKVASGVTPKVVALKSGAGYFDGETYTIKFVKQGYKNKSLLIDSSLDGWYMGNLLIGGLIGMLIIDPATGAMWSLPKEASASLFNESAPKVSDTPLEVKKPSVRVGQGLRKSSELASKPSKTPLKKVKKAKELRVFSIEDIPVEYRDKLIPVDAQ